MRKQVLLLIGLIVLVLCLPMAAQASFTVEPVNKVWVWVPQPQAGESFPAADKCTVLSSTGEDDDFVKVTSVSWYIVEGVYMVLATDLPAKGEQYICRVGIYITDTGRGYFPNSAIMVLNNNDQARVDYRDSRNIAAYSTPMVPLVRTISSASIDLPLPEVGMKISDAMATTQYDNGFKLRTFWYDRGAPSSPTTDVYFEYGKMYKATIHAEATERFVFTSNCQFKYVGGLLNTTVTGDRNTAFVSTEFISMPKEFTSITRVDIQIPLPQVGQQFSKCIAIATSMAEGVKLTTNWYNRETSELCSEGSFERGSTYYASLTVDTVGGYGLSNDTQYRVNAVNPSVKSRRGSTSVTLWSQDFMVRNGAMIEDINVQITNPLSGRTPADISVTTTTEGVYISSARWYVEETGTWLTSSEAFKDGVDYVCEIRADIVSLDYEINVHTKMIVNGYSVPGGIGNQWGYYYLRSRSPSIKAGDPPVELPTVDVLFPIPRALLSLNSVGKPSTSAEHVRLGEVSWYRVDTAASPVKLTEKDRFVVDGLYYCTFSLYPETGYAFSTKPTLTMVGDTLNGVMQFADVEASFTSVNFRVLEAGPPIVVRQPTDLTVRVGDSAALAFEAAGYTYNILKYQWYEAADGTKTTGFSVGSAGSSPTFQPPTLEVGTRYYFCRVSHEIWVGNKLTTFSVRSDTVTVNVVSKATLRGIRSLRTVTGVPNGSPKTAEGLGLPKTVTLGTTTGNVRANVKWDVDTCSYDVEQKNEQKFAVQGLVTLPSSVSNPNNVSLRVRINVTVKAYGDDTEPTEPSYEISDDTDEALYYVEWLVHYDANGGYGPVPEDVFVQSGQPYTIESNTFAREDHVFSGWRTTPEGGTFHAPATTFVVYEDTTLYAQWTAIPPKPLPNIPEENIPAKDETLPKDETPPNEDNELKPTEKGSIQELQFTIDSRQVLGDGTELPELDVPAMVINGRTMIPFRYFIETALGGVANFDASTYTITATVLGHTIVMVVEDTIIYVDGQAVELSQGPTIVDSRTLVPLRLIETIAKNVGWDPVTRKATIVL